MSAARVTGPFIGGDTSSCQLLPLWRPSPTTAHSARGQWWRSPQRKRLEQLFDVRVLQRGLERAACLRSGAPLQLSWCRRLHMATLPSHSSCRSRSASARRVRRRRREERRRGRRWRWRRGKQRKRRSGGCRRSTPSLPRHLRGQRGVWRRWVMAGVAASSSSSSTGKVEQD